METFDSPSFSDVRFKREISLNRAAMDRRRLMTIFNHLRDKPARSRYTRTRIVSKSVSFVRDTTITSRFIPYANSRKSRPLK